MSETPKHMRSSDIRTDWKDVLTTVQNGGEIVIEHYRKPIARIVPIEEPAVTTYATRNDAIQSEIIAPIEAGNATADEYDIDAIADAVLAGYEDGYALTVDTDTFWTIVADHAR